ncbi:MAG: hypothetical protein NTY77_16505 [Elusimicrobia bacterium]|nr:hypothetical protein [Elusimicrobiota bacterium]
MDRKDRRGLAAAFLAALLVGATAAESGWIVYKSVKRLPRLEAACVASLSPSGRW